MRTQEEIVAEIKRAAADELLPFTAEAIIGYLDFEHAKEFLKLEAKAEDWKQDPLTKEAVLGEMRTYMAEYGWDKALGHRGISANRTVTKMAAWTWLLGDEPITDPYPSYGVPILKALCERYGFPIPGDEAVERMARGEGCSDHCEEGCHS